MAWNSLSRGTEEENALNAQLLSFALHFGENFR